ncbi:50S ribosomal protein L21e [Candidatus Micrarchaeota archaeon RBG_16_49_10]|nr:MAG: 50S ribosomal protein L21e [Candidatus Micrarchaeota archaeon RBG_16_49_10]
MVTKSRGVQAKTRSLLKRGVRERTTVNKILEEFKEGQKVIIDLDPSSDKGRPFRRFQGRMGVVEGFRGRSYVIKVKDNDKEKVLIASSRHLRSI